MTKTTFLQRFYEEKFIGEVCKITGVQPSSGGTGFRSIANTGSDAIQEVPHFHTHIIGGRNLGRMISQA